MSGPSELDPVRQEEIRTTFLKVLDTAPEERDAVLEASCGSDGELRREVEELLAASEDADEVLWSLARRTRVPLAGSSTEFFAEGRRLGAYRLLRQIGQGGMGAVYLAERADRQFVKQVAIKLLPIGLNGGAARERFLAERQILAQLEHPGIARLLDAGIAEDGTPFFAMEYVVGEPIDRYCERLALGIPERLDLFLQVCAAVEYAHRNLVVHRDLKPANILVTPERTVKLLDFGIAKVLDAASPGEATALTHVGGRPMTPAYASPEQVRGEPITTATDVYALGVLLYQLLAGRAPYQVAGLSPADLEHLVCTRDPITPSAAALAGAAEQGFDAAAASAAASKHARRLRGDLDTIVLMALRKEPERRYRSVAALADDLLRHREDRPVQARPSRFRYRAGKFVRRQPGAAAVIGVTLMAMGAYLATLQFHAERLEAERDRTRVEAARSERVSEFMVDLFREADPFGSPGPLSLRDVLDRGSEQLTSSLDDDPEVRARLMETLGEVYRRLGAYDDAGQLLTEALRIRREIFGDEHLEVASTLRNLGSLYTDRGDYAAAIASHRDALALQRRLLGSDHRHTAHTIHNLANALQGSGELGEAERLYREALAANRALTEGDAAVATNLSSLGQLLIDRGEHAAAEAVLREALEIRQRILGREHPRTAVTLNNLAGLLRRSGDPAAAEPLLRESLEIRRRTLGDDHPSVAVAVSNLGLTLQAMNRLDEAEPLFRESLDRRVAQYGETHPAVATARFNLGRLLHRTGRLEEAEESLREALAVWTATLRPRHPSLARARHGLGRVLFDRGNVLEAAELLSEALAVSGSPRNPEEETAVASMAHLLALTLEARGDLAGADSLLSQAHAIRFRVLGADHEDTIDSRSRLELLRSRPDSRARPR